MAAGTGNKRTCGWEGCANPLKPEAVRCHLHINKGVVQQDDIDAIRSRMEATKQSVAVPSFINPEHGYSIHYFSDKQMHVETLSENTPVDKKTADSIVAAVATLQSKDQLEIPQAALDSIETDFPQFIKALSEHGIARNRIQVMTLQGLDRLTMRGTRQSAPEAYHEVVVLDRGTEREVVVDPFISIYAPVRKLDGSVNDQLPSGYTPFGDVPWIGPMDEYVDGAYMQWNNVNYQNERA